MKNIKYTMNVKKNNLYHVAIIMDGNGRWAQQRGQKRIEGHKQGFKTAKKIVKLSIKKNIKMLTLYTFSTENWSRPKLEIIELMNLFLFALKKEINNLNKYDIQLKIIGDISSFSKSLQYYMRKSENLTQNNKGLILNIAANYGGRWDIAEGAKNIAYLVQKGILQPSHIQEKMFSQHLSTSHLLPIDLVIRTGGEKRISNFLLWQIAYSELYFTDILWPDFNELSFQQAINFFMLRHRRFGTIK